MPTEKKVKAVSDLEQTMAKSKIIVLSDYRGVTAPQITTARRKLRGSNSEIKVVKNTLARLAASKAGKEALVKSLEGPIAITFGYGDVAATVKARLSAQGDAEDFLDVAVVGVRAPHHVRAPPPPSPRESTGRRWALASQS